MAKAGPVAPKGVKAAQAQVRAAEALEAHDAPMAEAGKKWVEAHHDHAPRDNLRARFMSCRARKIPRSNKPANLSRCRSKLGLATESIPRSLKA